MGGQIRNRWQDLVERGRKFLIRSDSKFRRFTII